jgi:hypothetical protein
MKLNLLCTYLVIQVFLSLFAFYSRLIVVNQIKDVLQHPLMFMDNLVSVSKLLTSVPSLQYQNELNKQVEQLDSFIKNLSPSAGLVYIPILKPFGSLELHRVVQVPQNQAYPIPTYGRVKNNISPFRK